MCLCLYAIGVPAILNLALPSFLISALNAILSAYSQVYILVLGAYYKLQTFLYLPANGIIQGMRPVISYNYGAGEHGRVRQIYRTVLVMTGGHHGHGHASLSLPSRPAHRHLHREPPGNPGRGKPPCA